MKNIAVNEIKRMQVRKWHSDDKISLPDVSKVSYKVYSGYQIPGGSLSFTSIFGRSGVINLVGSHL